ncbi:uncharacterized protein TNCV_320221 [Trichonephila clavipes]|nr:uncharacterized protein TNCV_320221 [Trichonephila clavipes]
MRFLELILTLPMSMPFNSYSSKIEISSNLISQRVEDFEKKLPTCENATKESKFVPAAPLPVPNSPVSIKLYTYDGNINWEVYKIQFELLNYNALDLRFGQKLSKYYVRLQIKTRRQKPMESLQEYASEVERLANLAFSDHSATVREVISLQYFAKGLKDGEIQRAVRMADVQDLKSALKLEAANGASCRDRHSILGARVTANASCESLWIKEIEKLREGIQYLMAQRQNLRRRRITCWWFGGAGHLRSNCPRINKEDHNIKCWVCGRTGHRAEKKFGVIDSVVHQVTTPSTSELDPWSGDCAREKHLTDPKIKPIIEFKESSNEKPSWQDIELFHPTTKRYWALWDSLHLSNGVLYRKWESDDGKTFRWQLILPKTRISTVLKELHGSPTGGHFGVMKTLQKVRERFYWNNVRSDVEKCCRICDPCAARKGPRKRTR